MLPFPFYTPIMFLKAVYEYQYYLPKMNFSTPFSRSFVLYVLLTLPVINTWRMEHENCGEDPCAANPGFTEPDPAAMEFDGGQSAASDRSAGIGMEYESAYIQFESDTAKRDPDPGKISNRRVNS